MKKFVSIVLILSVVFSCFALNVSAFQEGETKICHNSWGIEVYLSREAVSHIGGGIAVGEIFVPEPVVKKVMSVMGFAIGCCPGGIVLEYHYGWVAFKILNPFARQTLFHPTGFRWQ